MMSCWKDAAVLLALLGVRRETGALGRRWACPSKVISFGAASVYLLLSRWGSLSSSWRFEGHACAHMDVWNEGKPTDGGGGQVVFGQYCHGPTSPKIIRGLNCVFLLLHGNSEREKARERERETDGVYVKADDLKVGER